MLQEHKEPNHQDHNFTDEGHCLTSFQRKLLNKNLHTSSHSKYRQRIEIMLLADQGYSQAQICEKLNCCQQTARYWIAMAQAGKAHQWNDYQVGRPKTVNEQYLHRLRELVKQSPREYGYFFQRWTAHWLGIHLLKETGINVSDRHINRLLNEMGLSTRSKPQRGSVTEEVSEAKQTNIRIRDLSPSEFSM